MAPKRNHPATRHCLACRRQLPADEPRSWCAACRDARRAIEAVLDVPRGRPQGGVSDRTARRRRAALRFRMPRVCRVLRGGAE